MKNLLVLSSVLVLLAGLPLAHGFLVFASFDELSATPGMVPFFYLFSVPVWLLSAVVFIVEVYRRSLLRIASPISSALLLGALGLLGPAAGLALSPVAPQIGMVAFLGIGVLGFGVGLLGAVLYNGLIGRINRFFDS